MPTIKVPCECASCQQSEYLSEARQIYAPYRRTEPIIPTSGKHAFAILAQCMQQTLRQLLQLHGSTIVKRWRRKTRAQRQTLLHAANPLIPRHGDSVFLLNVTDSKLHPEAGDLPVVARFLPYLNQQDLSADCDNLLGLLHYRTKYPLAAYAVFDAGQLQPAWTLNGLPHVWYMEGCIGMLQENYGICKSIDLDAIHRGVAFGCPKAQLVFIAQIVLMISLLEIVAKIMHDQLPKPSWAPMKDLATLHGDLKNVRSWISQLSSNSSPAVVRPILNEMVSDGRWIVLLDDTGHVGKPTNDVSETESDPFFASCARLMSQRGKPEWTSLYALHRARAFCSPPQFDIDHLLELTKGRLQEMQDDLWLLQTDPGYFHDRITFYEQRHSNTSIALSLQGSVVPIYESIKKSLLEPLNITVEWHDLLQDLEKVASTKGIALTGSNDIRELPEAYDLALACLFAKTTIMLEKLCSALTVLLTNSPFFCNNFIIRQLSTGPIAVQSRHRGLTDAYEENKLYSLLLIVCSMGDAAHFHTMAALKQIDDIMTVDPNGHGRSIDTFMSSMLSDICLLVYIQEACRLHQPHHQPIKKEDVYKLPEPGWQRLKALEHQRQLQVPKSKSTVLYMRSPLDIYQDSDLLEAEGLCQPISKFSKPRRTGRKDKQWLTRVDDARAELIKLWEAVFEVQNIVLDRNGLALEYREIYEDESVRYYRAPAYLKALNAERQSILQESIRTKVPSAEERLSLAAFEPVALSPSLLVGDRTQDFAKRFTQEPTQFKLKTRGNLSETIEASPNRPATQECRNNGPLYYLPHKHFAAIDLMFGASDGEPTRGSVEWTAFANAMLALGFTAIHCGGSGVRFEGVVTLPNSDTDEDPIKQKQSIMVHKPHPDPRMEREILRNIGKRLSRRMGWARAHFATEERRVEGKSSKAIQQESA